MTESLFLYQELQTQLEESVRSLEACREEQLAMERRCSLLVSEGAETCASLEITERSCKALEMELQNTREKLSDLNNQVKRRVSAGSSAKNQSCVGRINVH